MSYNVEVTDMKIEGHSATGKVTITYEERMWFCGDTGTEEKAKKALIDAAIYQINTRFKEGRYEK